MKNLKNINKNYLFALVMPFVFIPEIVRMILLRFYDNYYDYVVNGMVYRWGMYIGLALAIILTGIFLLPKAKPEGKTIWANKFLLLMLVVIACAAAGGYAASSDELYTIAIAGAWILIKSSLVILIFQIWQKAKTKYERIMLAINVVILALGILPMSYAILTTWNYDECYVRCIDDGNSSSVCALSFCD